MDEFAINFNKGKQFITVTLWDVHPTTFNNWGGGYWAYIIPKWEDPRIGFFAEFHGVKSGIREDTVAHEMVHVAWEYFNANNIQFIRRNEERFASLTDELVRKFFKYYRKK